VAQSDIQFVVCLCARFQASPRSSHQTTVKRIFKYLKHTPEFEIWYSASSSLDLVGFSNANFSGCGVDRKSTSGTCHFLRSSPICWSARKQSPVAQSATGLCSCCSQILWIVQTKSDYGVPYKSVPLMHDSSTAICLAHNPVFHGRAKHIKVRHHFLRDHVEKGEIDMKFIDTER
jgi:hypothetical protein